VGTEQPAHRLQTVAPRKWQQSIDAARIGQFESAKSRKQTAAETHKWKAAAETGKSNNTAIKARYHATEAGNYSAAAEAGHANNAAIKTRNYGTEAGYHSAAAETDHATPAAGHRTTETWNFTAQAGAAKTAA
jgi:hypothetical protein